MTKVRKGWQVCFPCQQETNRNHRQYVPYLFQNKIWGEKKRRTSYMGRGPWINNPGVTKRRETSTERIGRGTWMSKWGLRRRRGCVQTWYEALQSINLITRKWAESRINRRCRCSIKSSRGHKISTWLASMNKARATTSSNKWPCREWP